jgi:ribosomal protein S27AE
MVAKAEVRTGIDAPSSNVRIPAYCLNCGGGWLVRLTSELVCGYCGYTLETYDG